MKIVFFSSDNTLSNGAFKAEISLIKDLETKGHNVTLVLPYLGSGEKLVKLNKIKTKHIFTVPWVCPQKRGFVRSIWSTFSKPINKFALKCIKKFLSQNKFDLAVINTLWTGTGAEAAIFNSIPVVWHLREILEAGQNFTFIDKQKSYALINKAKKCIAVSQYVKDYYSNNINHNIIDVIYDGVDSSIFYNTKKQLFSNKKIHFLMVGTVNKPKGQHIGLKALNSLSKYDFDVKIVGRCSRKYKNELLKLSPNLKNRISFVRPTIHPEVYYQQSDIFLMNSIGEAFGLVTAEAMMSGLVVVVSKCGANVEIINNDQNGYFYEPNNWQNLASQIEYILNNKNEAVLKSKNGQKYAFEHFDKKMNSNNIEKIYLSIKNNIFN